MFKGELWANHGKTPYRPTATDWIYFLRLSYGGLSRRNISWKMWIIDPHLHVAEVEPDYAPWEAVKKIVMNFPRITSPTAT